MRKNTTSKHVLIGLDTALNQKSYLLRWFEGITKAMEAVLLAENTTKPGKKDPPRPARIVSRADLSSANPKEERAKLLKDKELCFGNKGFYGSPLPLIPDIRSSDVTEGLVGGLLETFGVRKRFGRIVTLYQGPNRRANRYLVIHYNRLIKSIDGQTVKGSADTIAHIAWSYNFYSISKTDGVKSLLRKQLRGKARVF